MKQNFLLVPSLLIIFVCVFSTYGEDSLKPKALVFKSEAGEVLEAFPLNNSIVRFQNDSVVISNSFFQSVVSLAELDSIDHLEEYNTDLTLYLSVDNTFGLPIEGSVVTLHGGDKDDFYEMEQISDTMGMVQFKNLPVDFYDLYIRDENNVFYPFTAENIIHTLNNNHKLRLIEDIRSPYNLDCRIEYPDSGLPNVSLSWEIAREDDSFEIINEYQFYIFVNGVLQGETNDTHFDFKVRENGEFVILVSAISCYGNLSPELCEAKIEINDEKNIIDTVETDESKFIYYDLNGLPVNGEILSPGIYIRKDASGRMSKILVR